MTQRESRVIVKNLPKWITEDRLKAIFSERGRITDLKLMYTRSGVFRRFAYIGFSSEQDAASAFKYFDKTFIDTSRIQVELAKPMGSEELSRPWSKYSSGSSLHDTYTRANPGKPGFVPKENDVLRADLERKKKLLASIYDDDEKDPKLKSFVAATKSTSKTKIWENDGGEVQLNNRAEKNPTRKDLSVIAVPNKKPGGQGQFVTKVHVRFEENDAFSLGEEKDCEAGSGSEGLYEDFPQVHNEHIIDGNEGVSTNNNPEEEPPKPDSKDLLEVSNVVPAPFSSQSSPQPIQDVDFIAENGRLYVRNLSYECTEDNLKQLFGSHGVLNEVHMSISKETKKPKGFAYVQFMFPQDAVKAYSSLDGSIFQGRLLHILPAMEKPQLQPGSKDSLPNSFQKKKDEELKKLAQQDYNWNSLFMRPDAVLDAIATKLGVQKSSIMNVASDNLATRLAVAETHIIQETKSYLEAEGVVLNAFEAGSERSKTIILVKNLPFDTEISDLRKLFERHGSIGRVVLPPTKSVALIEFFEPFEARNAFKTLAYSKFKHVPLFLEWAPTKSFIPRGKDSFDTNIHVVLVEEPREDSVEADAISNARTIYVKNLSFTTSPDSLKTVFSSVGPVRAVTVASKKKDGKVLSLGFGFVEFERSESVNRALDELQGYALDGHALVLRKSLQNASSSMESGSTKRKSSDRDAVSDEKNAGNTKLLIRNIPFEATLKDIKELFSSFAQIKRFRLPKRFGGQHRGFGFVEFLTHKEAANAKETLAHTHLYGRHLVIEWAKEETGTADEDGKITQLREKTKSKMNLSTESNGSANKKLRLDETNADDVRIMTDGEDE